MAKKGSITYQIQRRLQTKLAPGTSKHAEKSSGLFGAGKPDPETIHSYRTMEAYMEIGNRFARWAQEQHGRTRDLDDLRPYASEWLQQRVSQVQPSTVKQERAALAKLYDCAARISSRTCLSGNGRILSKIVPNPGEDTTAKKHIEKSQRSLRVPACAGMKCRG